MEVREASEPAVFFSDVHVDPRQPEKTAALLEFLERVRAERYRSAFVLGDLFNFWVGRGQEDMAEYRAVLERLAALVRDGCGVTLVHGNRDFHLGGEIAAATGAAIIPEGAIFRIGGRIVHVAHGDALCLRDTSYQAMRRLIRSRPARRGFLALPLAARLRVGYAFRRQSVRSVKAKATHYPRSFAIMPSAVRRLFRGEVALAIVGHVHHARRIGLVVAGRARTLVTLGSWDEGNRSWLELRDGTYLLFDGPGGERVLRET